MSLDVHAVLNLPLRMRREDLERLRAAILHHLEQDKPEEVAIAVSTAQRLLRVRRAREQLFELPLFADPSWDILLDLYVQRCTGRQTSLSSACLASAAPVSTSMRHLKHLIDNDLIRRDGSGRDQRVQNVELTQKTFELMTRLLNSF